MGYTEAYKHRLFKMVSLGPCSCVATSSAVWFCAQVCDSGILASGLPSVHSPGGDHIAAPAPSSSPTGQRPVCGGGQAGQLHPHPARADPYVRPGGCGTPPCPVPHCSHAHHGRVCASELALKTTYNQKEMLGFLYICHSRGCTLGNAHWELHGSHPPQ